MIRRRALVVGASSEIGRSLAVELGELDHDLLLWGRDRDRLADCVRQVRATGVSASAATVDVTDGDALLRAVADIDRPLHVAVWAPGRFDWAPADQADPAVWQALIDVNLRAPTVFTALVAPLLVSSAPSCLVYLGSGAGHQAYADNAAYVASKHGLTGLARATFLDLRDHGVKVSLLSPGLVAAGSGLLSGAGQERPEDLVTPADVAAALRFVVASSPSCCPTEIHLQPLRSPASAARSRA